jgi:S-adenosylmethionine/arginine decarboxylase-like enzyme
MKTFKKWLMEADYCQGLSLNCDFWWNKGTDVSFLTMGGKDFLTKTLEEATKAGKMVVFDKRLTSYGADPNFGFSYLIVLGQSHVMLHTWPEKYMLNIDVFTCGSEGDPQAILDYVKKATNPAHVQMNQAQRGVRKDIENANEKPDSPKDLKTQ